MTIQSSREELSWWPRFRQHHVWGRPASDLELIFDQPSARGLLRPSVNVERLVVRPAIGRDHLKLETVRRDNRSWLSQWEATLPVGSQEAPTNFAAYRKQIDSQMQAGDALIMVVEPDEQVAGLVSIGGVHRGAMSMGNLGYWIGEEWAHLGITSLAVAAVMDLVLGELGMHRLEVNVRPENEASLALARGLGLRHEGLRVRYMCINGRWADHESFAIDQEMLRANGGLVENRIVGRYL